MHVCTDITGFGKGSSYLTVEFVLQTRNLSLGDVAHHTVSTVETMVIFTHSKAFYGICYICNGKLQILVAYAKVLTCKFVFSRGN